MLCSGSGSNFGQAVITSIHSSFISLDALLLGRSTPFLLTSMPIFWNSA